MPLASLASQPHALSLTVAAAGGINPDADAWMICLTSEGDPATVAGALALLQARLRREGAVPLSRPGPECLVASGGASRLPARLSAEGLRIYAWAPGLFADPEIAITPQPTAEQANDPVLHLVASVFRGADVVQVEQRLEALGATLEGRSGGLIALAWRVDDLRAAIDALTGIPLRGLAERALFVSADEEASTSLQTGEFNGGRRPYVEAGVDGSSQVIAVSDTGLSLDATVFADGVSGAPDSATPGIPGLAHRKIVGYVRAGDLPGNAIGGGDLLTCDGASGLTHGHLVASIAAAHASDLLDDIRLLPGFATARVGTATPHAVDGLAPGARVLFIDTQAAGACSGNAELEMQNPGLLSANTAAARTFGLENGLDLRIHNLSFSRYAPPESPAGSYPIEAQDLDAFLHDNQDFLIVVAAGNRGEDSQGDGNLDLASITSPGTAKNVLTVGASVYPNDTLDPDAALVRGVPNRGIEMIARFGNLDSPTVLSSSQGPAAFTTSGVANDWRIKPDVVAPGDETVTSERLLGPVSCMSTDDDQDGPVECARHAEGVLAGTSFAAAGVTGAAALVRDYFRKGFAPAGRTGGPPRDLSGPELKAALIASADLMTGNPTWARQVLTESQERTFYNPRHLTRPTPEQGYGRVQLDHLLPLASDPVTPSFILSESVPLALVPSPGSVHERLLRVVRADEEFRVVTAWYDLESDQTGNEAEGRLVRDLDLTLADCGPDGECDTADDLTYFGNHFHEDENFDTALANYPDEFRCGGVGWGARCTASSPDCDDSSAGTSCLLTFDSPDEDCDDDGLLDKSEFSLPIDPQRVGAICDSGARDRNNPVEAIFLSPAQLVEGRRLRLRLAWVGTSELAPPPLVAAGLVIVGGFTADGAADRIRLDKAEYGCADVLDLEVIDGLGDATAASVGASVIVISRDAAGGTLDRESAWEFQPTGGGPPDGLPRSRFSSTPRAVSSRFVPVPGDGILTVIEEGRIEASYAGGSPGTGDARASAQVRCQPEVTLLPVTRRGRNPGFGLSGGCDPRARVDPRGILFGQVPGTGLNTSGDRFLDAGESLVYSVILRNDDPEHALADTEARLRACMAGTVATDGECLPAPEVQVLGTPLTVGSIAPGHTQTASFNLRVGSTAAFPKQVDLVFEVVPDAGGHAAAHRSVFRHVLDVDSFDDPNLGPDVDGVYRYSTDFPRGGREVRILAAEGFDPADPNLAAETFDFQDATVSGPGLLGNATLLGFDPGTGRFDRAIPNNWPWTFDLDDEAWGSRRHVDSDPGANAELAARNVWQWNNTGECGFQSNDSAQPDGQISGRGGIWHTGHALSQPGTPAGRTGYDLGCENFDIPGDVTDYRREAVLDVVSSPVFHRVHAGPDPLGFAYTLEFTRFAFNAQFSARDVNPIFAWELDPDASVREPVDPLDFGWLSSDQGPGGFLAVSPGPSDRDMPHAVFNPNDPHEVSSARALGMPLVPGGAGQNIAAVHGRGSAGPFRQVGNSNKAPARSFGEIAGVLSGRGFGSPSRRGAAGLPLRNREELLDGFEGGGFTFEDLFGPNETLHDDPGGPVSPVRPERLAARRDDFQVSFMALLRENASPFVLALPSYGLGIDDVVVEWIESHPVADRTPCADPSTWTPDGQGGPSAMPERAGGCAGVAWDRPTISDPETALVLTVLDADAQFGPDGIDQEMDDPSNDDQANDIDGDGFAEIEALVVSDSDPVGEVIRLEQAVFVSAVYQAVVQVSASAGSNSTGDGVIFVQGNGDGTDPVALTAAYADQDVNVSGVNGAAVPCPDNPLIAMALTDFVAADILFVTARVTDEGPNADGDGVADDGETIRLEVAMFNRALEPPGSATDVEGRDYGWIGLTPRRGTLRDVEVRLLSTDPDVGCILDGTARFAALPDNELVWSGPDHTMRFVVARPTRTSATAVVQAEFTLAIRGEYTDHAGARRRIAAFATPQRFALNLDLDIGGESPASPLSGDAACVGGSSAGRACASLVDCPGEVAPGQPASCELIPGYLRTEGTSPIAGAVGYFEGFEGAASGAGAGLLGTADGTKFGPIPGTGFRHAAAINLVNGFMPRPPVWPPLVPPQTGADVPEGSSAVDGSRCQYHDPRGPSQHPRSEAGCRPWTGSDWHVSGEKAFSGQRSLRGGTDGSGLGKDASYDSYHTNQLSAAFTAPMTIGVAGGAILSIRQIVQVADDRTFGTPNGQTVDRAYVQVAPVDPVGSPTGTWRKVFPFQVPYDSQTEGPFHVNCLFDPYDDFHDAEASLSQTPGFDRNATSRVGIPYNRDDVSSEDDYFDPNDPQRLFGPSSGCFPEFAFAAVGDYTALDPTAVSDDPSAARGAVGSGIWVNPLFGLDEFAGQSLRIRFLFTGIDIAVGRRWDELFGNQLGNAFRGWVIDDVAVSGLLSGPVTLAPDTRVPGEDACPADPDPATPAHEAACGSVVADAGPDLVAALSATDFTLDGSASHADACIDGTLVYRWRVGGAILSDFRAEPNLAVRPADTTVYTLDVRCSTDPTCAGSDRVAVQVEDAGEVSGLPATLGMVRLSPEAPGSQQVLTEWEAKPGATDIFVLGVNVQNDGRALRDPSPGAAAALARHLCHGGAALPGPPGRVEGTEGSVDLAAGEIFGYLAVARFASSAGPVHGSLGQGESPGRPAASPRGRVDPTTLADCADSP